MIHLSRRLKVNVYLNLEWIYRCRVKDTEKRKEKKEKEKECENMTKFIFGTRDQEYAINILKVICFYNFFCNLIYINLKK